MSQQLNKLALARALLDAGDYLRARQAYQRLYASDPASLEVLFGLCRANSSLNDLAQARFYSQRLAAIPLSDPEARLLVANVLIEVGDAEPAIEYIERSRLQFPAHSPTTRLLLQVLYFTRRTARARLLAQSLLATDPNDAPVWHGFLAAIARSEGRVREAMDHHRLEVAGLPESVSARMQIAISSLYDDRCTPEEVAGYHRDLARVCALPSGPPPGPRGPGPLRVGVLSPDFVTHSVAYFALPMVHGLVQRGVQVTCYATGNKEDETTVEFKRAAGRFRSAWTLSARALADQVRGDGIDVLFDLAGLSLGARTDALALHPAPFIVNYCGYPCSIGSGVHTHRIVDSITDPPGSEGAGTEELLRLDPCFLCYRPRADAPSPRQPASASPPEGVTFGSFNVLTKVNESVIDTWSRILHAVPGSSLALKSSMLTQDGVQDYFTRAFEARSIDAARLRFLPFTAAPREHLALYRGIDIALDPFPYNGTTTTCEALAMGVPVVTLEGRAHAGRVGSSLLKACAMHRLVAKDVDAYVKAAVGLAADRQARMELHGSLPGFFARSALRDEAGFADRMHGLLNGLIARLPTR